MKKSLVLAAMLMSAIGTASAQSTHTSSAQPVMSTAGNNGCVCPGMKEKKPECCPPPDKKK